MSDSIVIIGAGITGLATAYVLSSRHTVTIVARDLPGDLGLSWASPWAGAAFHPQRTTDKLLQGMQMASFQFYWNLAQTDSSAGVKAYQMTEYSDMMTDDSEIWFKEFMPDYRVIPASKLPPRTTFGMKYTTVAMNPLILLPWLKARLLAKGVTFRRAQVKTFEEARSMTKSDIVVNASGLGARELAGDASVKAIRGQTMFVKTDFSELLMKEGSEYTYLIPRAESGGVIMGGIKSERQDHEVDEDLKREILMKINRISGGAFDSLDLQSVTDIIGFRPGRDGGMRIEREGDIIHAYGLAGTGYIYSFGVAERVKALIEREGRARL